MTHFDIKIVSDTVCPWCYVGKKRLEKAIAQYKEAHPDSGDTFSTTWYPFYLNPDAPHMEKRAYYKQRFGEERLKGMEQFMGQLGEKEGINFSFDGRTGPTRDSHRLIQLGKAKSPAMQTRVIEELFADYFERARDIAARSTLVEAGIRAGLDEAEVTDWLDSGKGGPEVDREVQEAVEESISGVPNFTIQDKFNLSGAQEPAAFVSIFERVKK